MSEEERTATMQTEQQSRLLLMERNPLQKAYDSYYEMERERDRALGQVADLSSTNNTLLAEINMLRNQVNKSDADASKFQSVAGILLGRLLSINDTIAGAVKASLNSGIEPATDTDESVAVSPPSAEVTNMPEDKITPEDEQALNDLALHDPARRTIMPPVVYR